MSRNLGNVWGIKYWTKDLLSCLGNNGIIYPNPAYRSKRSIKQDDQQGFSATNEMKKTEGLSSRQHGWTDKAQTISTFIIFQNPPIRQKNPCKKIFTAEYNETWWFEKQQLKAAIVRYC